jgi:exopolysaccharide production protein ExoZ
MAADVRAGNHARINSLEVGRGLAALAVVVFHANASSRFFGGPNFLFLRVLEHGVDFFFVLSGFIIYTAHGDDIGKPHRLANYLKKRIIRLFPLLWFTVGAAFIARVLASSGQNIDPSLLLRSALPYPTLSAALPQVIWTLRHEILFYAAFGLLIYSRKMGVALFCVWILGVGLQAIAALAYRPLGGSASLVLSTYTIDFLLGIGLAAYHRRRHAPCSAVPLCIGLTVLVALLAATIQFDLSRNATTDYVSPVAIVWTSVLGLGFAMVVHGLARMEGFVGDRNLFVALGSYSYALYLVHTVVNSVMQRIAGFLPQGLTRIGAGHLLLVVSGIGCAILAHRYVEVPIARFLRRKWA